MADVRTPDLATVFRNAMERWSSNLHVMMPAKIVSYNHVTQLATVQPLLQKTSALQNASPQILPQLFEVPVRWPRVGLAVMYMPMRAGDKVALIFADNSLDNWQASNGEEPLDPQDLRSHDLTDGWVVPGMYPPQDAIPNVDPADIRIILFDENGNVRSQFYLGGDTGDIVSLAENLVMLGDAQATEQAVLGNALLTLFNANTAIFNAHIHPTPSGPSSATATPMTDMSSTQLATKVKLK